MGKNKRKRSHTKHVFVQKKYRDALFRRIFNEKSVLLELYNTLNQTDYDDADELIFYTIVVFQERRGSWMIFAPGFFSRNASASRPTM